MATMALEGLRILDATQVWAGPTCTKILGDMGAEVIKIESARRMDIARGDIDPRVGAGIYPDGEPGEEPWNRSGLYNDRNRSKLSACLDLTHPKGVATFKLLAAKSDVVIESFRSGVMERFGLTYADLKQVRNDIIMVSLSSQGGTGPERAYGSFGATLEQTAGIASITGYLGGDPTTSGTFLPDPMVSFLSVGVVLAAIEQRRRTGEGVYIDLSQREVTTSMVGEMVMDYTMNERTGIPTGNRDAVHAPQGVYPCAGDDSWIAITVRSDAEWSSFADLIGITDDAQREQFTGVIERHNHHGELDQLIADWTRPRDAFDVMKILQRAGIAAGVSLRGDQLLQDPHLAERGFWENVEHPQAGTHPHLSRPFKLSKQPGSTRMHAPLLGQHTEQVLREIAGLSAAEISELKELGVTSNDPTAV
jgi:benzylsuccinate CoA-transferase BbsF subunit